MHGYVLTNGKNPQYLYQLLRKDKVDILKIIPTWGFKDLRWNDYSRALILSATKETIIRTSHGDPATPERAYLIPESLYTLDPFLAIKPHCYIELGNEPNIGTVDFWVYRYWLIDAYNRLKSKYPYAKFISPAPSMDAQWYERARNFYEVCKDILMQFDYSGIHAYEYTSFFDVNGTDQLDRGMEMSRHYLGNKPMMLTEYGIDDVRKPMKAKLIDYKRMRAAYMKEIAAFTIFHIEADKEVYPQYSVTLEDV